MQYVHGVETELRKLAGFPLKIQQRVVAGALRAGASVMRKTIKPRVPVRTGELAATLRISTGRRAGLTVSAVKIGKRSKGVFYAAFVLGGTKAHRIASQGGLSFAGSVRRSVRHPGMRAQPFMDEAAASSSSSALKAVFDYADGRVRKIVEEQRNAP